MSSSQAEVNKNELELELTPGQLRELRKLSLEETRWLVAFAQLLKIPGFRGWLREKADELDPLPTSAKMLIVIWKILIRSIIVATIIATLFLVSGGGTFSSIFNRVRARTYDSDPGSTIDQWGNPTNQALRGYAFSHADNHVAPPEWMMSVCEYESGSSIHMKAGGLTQGDNSTSIDWGICQINDYWHADKMDLAKSPNWQDNFEVGWEILDSCWNRYSTDHDRVWCYNGYGLNATYPPRVVAKHESKFWLQDEVPYRSGEQAATNTAANEILKSLIAEFDTGSGSLSDLIFAIVKETDPEKTSPSATTGGFAYPVKDITDCGYDFGPGHYAVDVCEGRSLAQFGVYPPFPVYAACAGTISGSGFSSLNLSCRDYPGVGFWYYHIQNDTLPANGETFEVGEEMAKADGSITGGGTSSGIHLHFAAKKDGVPVEPLGLIASGGGVISQPRDAQKAIVSFKDFAKFFGEWEWLEGFLDDTIFINGGTVVDPELDSEPVEETPLAEEEEESILTWPGNGAVRISEASETSIVFTMPAGEVFIPVNVCQGEVSPQSNGESHLVILECDDHDIVITYHWTGTLSDEIEGGGHAEPTTLFGHTTSLTIKATTKDGQEVDLRPFFMTTEEIQEMQP